MLKGHTHHKKHHTSPSVWCDVAQCATWEFEREPGTWTPVTYWMYIVVRDNEIIDSGLAQSKDTARAMAEKAKARGVAAANGFNRACKPPAPSAGRG